MRYAFLVLGVMTLFAAAPANADPIDEFVAQTCHHYQWNMRGVLRERSDADRKRFGEGAALYFCRNDENQEVFSADILEAPHEDAIGLCVFGKWSVQLKGTRANGYYVSRESDIGSSSGSVMMRIKDGACPRQDDLSYIANENVPDGLFLQMLQLWQAMLRSPKAYEDALADDAKGDLALLRDWFARPGAAEHLRLMSVRAHNSYISPDESARGPAVALEWHIDANSGGVSAPYFVSFDWRGGVPKIVAVGEGKY